MVTLSTISSNFSDEALPSLLMRVWPRVPESFPQFPGLAQGFLDNWGTLSIPFPYLNGPGAFWFSLYTSYTLGGQEDALLSNNGPQIENFISISSSPLCDRHIFLVSVMDLMKKELLASISVVADLQYERLLNLSTVPVLSEVEEIFFYSFLRKK